MVAFFATEYTIHFDDTMAYGGHHFLTAFKFQCAARETFLFGEYVFDAWGVKEALRGVHLLTSDAYARNLHSTKLGDRVVILLTLEDWGRVSARFCYRVIDEHGQRVCAGFQTLICADATTGEPIPLPPPLRDAMDAIRVIEEVQSDKSFRDRVLAGGGELDSLFGDQERDAAVRFLSQRYPSPKVIPAAPSVTPEEFETADSGAEYRSDDMPGSPLPEGSGSEAWLFAGQGAFDAQLLSERVEAYTRISPAASQELERCATIATELIGGNAHALVECCPQNCVDAIEKTPGLLQVGIHLQNVLGAMLWQARGHHPSILIGHSFGEIAAFGIGNCFDLATGVRIVGMRAQTVAKYAPPNGGLLVVFADRHRVETEFNLLGLDHLRIAGRNHDRQVVVSGPLDQLGQLQKFLLGIGISAASVPSPTSFHHPQLQLAASHWLEQLRSIEFNRPTSKIYSSIGRRFISPDDDIAVVLTSQLLRPFDLQGAILDAVASGVTTFVDCGSKGSLASLVSKTCPDHLNVIANIVTSPIRDSSSHDVQILPPEMRLATVNQRLVPAVAIVGQGCILPGGGRSPEQLYASIVEQRMGIVDQRQFDVHWAEDFYSASLVADRSTSHLTGRVNERDIVVPAGVDPIVFDRFTRTQKLLCIALAPCVASLDGAERVLCLFGATADGFEDQDEVSSLVFAGIDPAGNDVNRRMSAGRSASRTPHDAIQEVVDVIVRPGLKVTLVDAACASSLYTIALGMQALESDEADAVIAGGCFCPGPGNSCLFSQFNGTTSTGCRPFDANADGVVFSEGAALVTLRRVADAERLGQNIHAIVRGVGLSSDGRSSSANVPQANGQILSLKRCYARYDINPASIDAIEAHGTSTAVGDSTELETLRRFFADHATASIPVHSLKATLGHAGWAAGTASVIAACEYLRHGIFPAQACHREPSNALMKAAGTLAVTTRPVSFPSQHRQIAIDGFGFGGSNAHLVLANYDPEASSPSTDTARQIKPTDDDDAVVFVAFHDLRPTVAAPSGLQFDRDKTKLPDGYIVLPELADDMDISQTLAVTLTERIISQLPDFDQDLRRETSLVLALRGKTERGVEATARIMTPRLRRNLTGYGDLLELLDRAHDRARPSGPYTLQCMMPNVAAGRAALLHNLNGPNFVVDAGSDSLVAAISSAALLLRGNDQGGTKLVIVAAIEANAFSVPEAMRVEGGCEFATAFGVTTRRLANTRGWKVISRVDDAIKSASRATDQGNADRSTFDQVQALLETLSGKTDQESDVKRSQVSLTDSLSNTDCKLHIPVWIEKPVSAGPLRFDGPNAINLLVVAPAHRELVIELLAILPNFASHFMVAVVGANANVVASSLDDSSVFAIDVANAVAVSSAMKQIDQLDANVVAVLESITSWDLLDSMTDVANDNTLCEFLFLLAKHNIDKLQRGKIELWALFANGWNGVVHPKSGAITGLLKSLHREIPQLRVGSICTRGAGLSGMLQFLLTERLQKDAEHEIVYDRNVRLVRRLRPATHSSVTTAQVELDSKSVVIATGGAKGVTAVMLEAILRDHQCTVIALGRSPLEAGPENGDEADVEQDFYHRFLSDHPNASILEMKKSYETARARWEAHRTIGKLKSLGGHIEYLVVDVNDRDQVAKAVKQIASRYGRVDLLIHGAGVQVSKRLEHRTIAEFQRTYSTKVAGLNNLVKCCRSQFNKTVSAHVLTSAYSIFGNDGQHDYCAANETLDRICDMARIGNIGRWSSIAWLAWDGIGMTRGSEYRVLAEQRSLSGIKPETGQRLFRDVMAGRTGSAINVPISDAEHVKYELQTVPLENSKTSYRMLEIPVELSEIECLPYHKIRNTPTLPGAWILDRLVVAAMQLYPHADRGNDITVEDVSFKRFVRFANGQEPNLRVVVQESDGSIFAWMLADVLHSTGRVLAKDVICAKAKLVYGRKSVHLRSLVDTLHAFSATTNRFGSGRFFSDPYCLGKDREVDLSGPFNCLSDIEVGASGRRARFAPQGHSDHSSGIPALLLDAAWRLGAMYAVAGSDDLFVPVQIGRIVIPGSVHSDAASASHWEIRSTPPRPEGRDVRWDRTEVLDNDGMLRLVVEDAFAKRLG